MKSIGSPGVLITRPADQLEEVSRLVERVGARAVPFPLLDIVPISEDDGFVHKILPSDRYALSIFVSRNAVRFGIPFLEDLWRRLPEQMLWIGVGRSTAAEMARHAISATFPELPSTEGVLSMAETRCVTGKRALIIRGQGGRELLAATLRERGAQVDYLEVYRRTKHPWTRAQLMRRLKVEHVRVAIVTSGEALDYLAELAGKAGADLVLLVPSARIADLAARIGFNQIRVTDGAGSKALASGVAKWLVEQRQQGS